MSLPLRYILAEVGGVVGTMSSLVTKDFTPLEGIVYGIAGGYTLGTILQVANNLVDRWYVEKSMAGFKREREAEQQRIREGQGNQDTRLFK